jgi:thiamine kinase-like enzyme
MSALEEYLTSIYGIDVKVTELRKLNNTNDRENTNEFENGKPLLVEVQVAGEPDQLVLSTVRPDKFAHQRRADRAGSILQDYDTFNKLPQHVPSLGVGAFTEGGNLLSLAKASEFFLVTHYASGRKFVYDLKKLLGGAELIPEDKTRVLALSEYLVKIHSQKHKNPALYHHYIRQLLGDGDGIFGLTDSYPSNFSIAPPSRLQRIERTLVDWRWRLKDRTDRLSQIHGDYHPRNILFQKDGRFFVLDRSRGEWGEPAVDVSAMTINFIFFSLQRYGTFRGTFKVLFDIFWEHYLQNTHDVEISNVIQPFYARHALFLAHPSKYPNVDNKTRQLLFNFIESVLAEDWFDPMRINIYLGVDDPGE